MSLHECPECGSGIGTNDTCAGAFDLPPTLYCLDCGAEMDLVDEDATVDTEAIANV